MQVVSFINLHISDLLILDWQINSEWRLEVNNIES